MIGPLEAIAVLKAIADTTGSIDKLYSSFSKWVYDKKVEPLSKAQQNYYESFKLKDEGRTLEHLTGSTAQKTITADQIATKLSKQDLIIWQGLDRRLSNLVRKWSEITGNIDNVIDIEQQAIYKGRLEVLQVDIARSHLEILDFLKVLGFILDDHYRGAEFVAQRALS